MQHLPIFAVSAYKVPAEVQAAAVQTVSVRLPADPQRGPRRHQGRCFDFFAQRNREFPVVRDNRQKDRVVDGQTTDSKYFFELPELQTSLVRTQAVVDDLRHRPRHVLSVSHPEDSSGFRFRETKVKLNLQGMLVVQSGTFHFICTNTI